MLALMAGAMVFTACSSDDEFENIRGQFANYLREKQPDFRYEQYNKVQGLPFLTAELEDKFNDLLK